MNYDLIVVGAGSGGYAAARTARALGASVAVVDPGPLGGLCILRGCMPSKTLIASGDLPEIREAGRLGVTAGEPRVDLPSVVARKRALVAEFAANRGAAIRTFPLYGGEARFLSPGAVEVAGKTLRARAFVVATGSVIAPAVVPGLAAAGFVDSDAALELERPPRSLVVLGGGYVGAELGQFFARVGVPTTMIFRSSQLLSSEDPDVGSSLTEYLREEGIAIESGAALRRVEARGGMKFVHFTRDGRERTVQAHEILYALGRVPNIAGLDLERAGVRAHPVSGIEIDATMRTSQPNIFAVGDVTGQHLLVHVAIYQGEIAARNAVRDGSERADYRLQKARTVFTDPQVAVVGATERELRAAGVAFAAASYRFDEHGKALVSGKTKGFVKMLASPLDRQILGVAIVGAAASDLIHEAIVAMHFRATVDEFAKIPHLHPTMAEIMTYPAEELVEVFDARQAPAAL